MIVFFEAQQLRVNDNLSCTQHTKLILKFK